MRTTLKDALAAWREGQEPGPHPSFDELYALASDGVARATDPVLAHLTRCGQCNRELRELVDAVENAVGFDMALAKAAEARITIPMSMSTACGKYEIAIYPRTDGSDEALITVEVTPGFREALEGSVVTVSDRTGRELLSATIVLGRAAGHLRGLASLDCTRLMVRSTRPAGQA